MPIKENRLSRSETAVVHSLFADEAGPDLIPGPFAPRSSRSGAWAVLLEPHGHQGAGDAEPLRPDPRQQCEQQAGTHRRATVVARQQQGRRGEHQGQHADRGEEERQAHPLVHPEPGEAIGGIDPHGDEARPCVDGEELPGELRAVALCGVAVGAVEVAVPATTMTLSERIPVSGNAGCSLPLSQSPTTLRPVRSRRRCAACSGGSDEGSGDTGPVTLSYWASNQGTSLDNDKEVLTPVLEKVVSNMQEVRARGAHVIAVATEGNVDIGEHAEEVIRVPVSDWMIQPLLAIIPLQLFAYHVAIARGTDVDQPRNLAKSVTVE